MTTPARGRFVSLALIIITALATVGVMALWQNMSERKQEAREVTFRVTNLTEESVDPTKWRQNFPRQYDSYRRTVDVERTRYGGSEAFQKLDEDPVWRTLFAGYPFGVDYREERGHAYMLSDQLETERVKQFKQPGACLHCHTSVLPLYRHAGAKAGISADSPREQLMKGFEAVCAMPFTEAIQLKDDKGHPLVAHPVTCLDCHDPATMALRVTRPGFMNAIQALAESGDPLPHLPSVERWRKGSKARGYDANVDASRQEMRSLVCAQCHVEYYFKGPGKLVTYPWHKGLKAEQIEDYYTEVDHTDWTHKSSGAKLLKAQHPEFELWSQGVHARSGVACADCHMPYVREGAIKVSDHQVRSPMLNVARACQTCHRHTETELLARVSIAQDRTKALMGRCEQAMLDAINAIATARERGADDPALEPARKLHRAAQWRLDFVAAENSMGFHAPQESARLLGEAIDLARQAQIAALLPPKPDAAKPE